MREHEIDILLRKGIERRTFGKDSADKFMVQFYESFLVRRRRIAIEEMNIVAFNKRRVGKLAAVIGEKDRKDRRKNILKNGTERIKTRNHRGRSVGVPKESKHEIARSKMQCEKNFAANASNDAIHLDNAGIGMLGHELFEISKRTANSARFIDLHGARRTRTQL